MIKPEKKAKKKAAKKPLPKKSPGDDLLSHEETSHYHWRMFVSLLSSRWNQVGPNRYGRQENWFEKHSFVLLR